MLRCTASKILTMREKNDDGEKKAGDEESNNANNNKFVGIVTSVGQTVKSKFLAGNGSHLPLYVEKMER